MVSPLCRNSWLKSMKKQLVMWKADTGKREERRRKKGPTLGQIIFEKILSNKQIKNQKEKGKKEKKKKKVKNQKIKFNFLFLDKSNLISCVFWKITLGLDFVPPTSQRSRWAWILCRQLHKDHVGPGFCAANITKFTLGLDFVPPTKAGSGLIPLTNSSHWGKSLDNFSSKSYTVSSYIPAFLLHRH